MFLIKTNGNKLVQGHFLECTPERCVLKYDDKCQPFVDQLLNDLRESEGDVNVYEDRVCKNIEGEWNGNCNSGKKNHQDYMILKNIVRNRKQFYEDALKLTDCKNGLRVEVFENGSKEYIYYEQWLRKH